MLLERMAALQASVERLPQVGGSLSLVDYLKNMNKNLHAGDPAYDRLPETRELVGEYLFLFSVSGRPQLLDEVAATLVVAGAGGFLGIPLDVSTALAAGIAIGVGVDYAVHFIYRYRQARDAGGGGAQALDETLAGVGRSILVNATIVAAGFLVLGLSQFPPHQKLGYFVAAYMALSCLAALILLPLVYLREDERRP